MKSPAEFEVELILTNAVDQAQADIRRGMYWTPRADLAEAIREADRLLAVA